MTDDVAKARAFAALHVPGRPLVLFNAWDPGSARAVAEAGAAAIATGSASVAFAFGYADGEALPIDLAIDNARRIVGAVPHLPVTIDFEGGYAAAPAELALNVARVREVGAVGINLEDQIVGGEGLYAIDEQCSRIEAIRRAVGPDFFINARTDLFLKTGAEVHASLVGDAVRRANAYAEAGASGFFIPALGNEEGIATVCAKSPIPVNAYASPAAPPLRRMAQLGVARISHGPAPYRLAMAALADAARKAHGSFG